jgi:hypothetical protein
MAAPATTAASSGDRTTPAEPAEAKPDGAAEVATAPVPRSPAATDDAAAVTALATTKAELMREIEKRIVGQRPWSSTC